MITAGIVAGNIIGFARVAVTAYLLGTGDAADVLAVSLGSLDTFNQMLASTMVFAFVPMLTTLNGGERTALFQQLNRAFAGIFLSLTAAIVVFAPGLINVLAPGLDQEHFAPAVAVLRVGAISTAAVGIAAVHSALLFTDRRFAPSAFHQATLNTFTMAGAVLLWRFFGVYAFAIGYAAGAWVQFSMVYYAARSSMPSAKPPEVSPHWGDLIAKPVSILGFSALIALNVVVTRAFATHAGPGTAAAFDYSMRCVGVPLAFLVSPMSNSLLPEIARLRSLGRLRDAFRLTDRTLALAAAAAVSGCALGIALRKPVIALLFQRGSFTAASTELVAAVFLGFAPSLIGWSLLELTARSLFGLDLTRLPLLAGAFAVAVNLGLLSFFRELRPEFIGVGSSVGLILGFLLLQILARARRRRLLA